jgi:hypothetical protein
MKTIIIPLLILLSSQAIAASPTIDSFHVQSFLKLSNNSPVNATSADFVFAIFKGTDCIWAKRYSAVAINSGVLNQKITGTGTNVTSINNASHTPGECISNFSGTTLDATLLNTGSPAALSIRIYTETTIDTYKPIWDIPLNSAPTAFVAETANSATTATTANDLAAGVKVTTSSGGADAGKFPVLNGSGVIDNSMINAGALTIANTQVTGLGTASTVNTGTTIGTIPVLGAGGRLAAAQLPTYSANKIMATDGSGVMNTAYDTVSVSAGASDSGKVPLLNGSGKFDNTMIDSSSLTPDPANLTTTVAVNKGGTGAATHTAGNILTGNGTGAITSIATVPVNKGGTGLATITANAVMIGNGTGAVTSVAPGAAGNLLRSNGTSWVSATMTTAQIADTVNTQTIGGAKTFSAAGVFSTSLRVGGSGTAVTGMFKCAAVTVPTGATDTVVTCTGAAATSMAFCSPAANLPAGWVLSYARGSALNQITLRVDQASGATGWSSTNFNCVVFN